MKDITHTKVQWSHDLAFFVGYFFMKNQFYTYFVIILKGGVGSIKNKNHVLFLV
jgi:hypothetical protein